MAARLAGPDSIVALPDGGFAVADRSNRVIRLVGRDGVIRTLAQLGEAGTCSPGQMALTRDRQLLVVSPGCRRVFSVSLEGRVSVLTLDESVEEPSSEGAKLASPTAIAVAPDGTVLVADGGRILRLGTTGTVGAVPLEPPIRPEALAVLRNGRVLATGGDAGVIWRIDPATGRTAVAFGHAVRTSGGTQFDPAVGWPFGLAATPDGGVLFADALGHRIRAIDSRGAIRTIAGTGQGGFAGDGGPAIAARLAEPAGVARRPDGGVLISDTGNDRVRLVASKGRSITTVAGTGPPPPPPSFGLLPTGDFPPWQPPPTTQRASASYIYDRLWNLFYIRGVPLRARPGQPIAVRLISSRAAYVVVTIWQGTRQPRSVSARVRSGSSTVRVGSLPAGAFRVVAQGISRSLRQNAHTSLVIR